MSKSLFQIIRMERIVFARVAYQLLAPTSWWFASRLVRMAHVPRIIYCMMRYLLELALLDHTFLDFRPSVIGAASFFLSNVIFRSDYLPSITETGEFYRIIGSLLIHSGGATVDF